LNHINVYRGLVQKIDEIQNRLPADGRIRFLTPERRQSICISLS
jgi:hypothetical protein